MAATDAFPSRHLVSAKTRSSCCRGGRRGDGHVAPSGTDGRIGNDELGKALKLRHLLLEAGDGRSLGGIESGLLEIDGVLALLQRIDLRLEFFVHLNELLVGVLVCADSPPKVSLSHHHDTTILPLFNFASCS